MEEQLKPGKTNHAGEGGGRPLRWATADELSKGVNAYFADCAAKEIPPGVYGLIDALNCGIQTFYDYGDGNNDTDENRFSEILRMARLKVAAFAESRVYANTAGAVSQLVNITKKFPEPYKNSQHTEVTGAGGGAVKFEITPLQASIT